MTPPTRVWQGDVHGSRRQLGVQGSAERRLGRELRPERDPGRRQHRAEPGSGRDGQVLLRPRDALDHQQPQRGDRERARLASSPSSAARATGSPTACAHGSRTRTATARTRSRRGRCPPGTYEAKVAHDESWDENYGAGGVASGANIAFSVPDADVPVTFSYDPATHVAHDHGRGRRRARAGRRAAGPAEPARRDRRGLLLRPPRPLRERVDPANDTGGLLRRHSSRAASTRPTRASTTAATCAA